MAKNFNLILGRTTALGHPLYFDPQTKKYYGYLSAAGQGMYYPLNEAGLPLPATSPPVGAIVPQKVRPLNLEDFDPPTTGTRRYALSNEDSADLLNHPQGIDWA